MEKNKYFDVLKEYYINRRVTENVCDTYNQIVDHKYRHTMEVIAAGEEIIKNEPMLNCLPDDVQQDFIDACLFHDVSRSFDIDPQTGKYLFQYHGIESAKVAKQYGVTSLNILIPVMLHDLINGSLLYLPMYELEVDVRYTCQSEENKAFIKEMRDGFYKLSEKDKEIVESGRKLVKDADMLANWRVFERMNHSRFSYDLTVNETVEKEFYNCQIVNLANVETFADYMILLMAWGTGLYHAYCLENSLQAGTLEKIRQFFVDTNIEKGYSLDEMSHVLAIIDKGIALIKSKMHENITRHGKPDYYQTLKEYYVDRRVQENTCQYYDEWMTHKYRHSVEVVNTGKEIIKNDKRLSVLPQEIQEDFINGCLFHDMARAIEINPVTGNSELPNHGVEGAKIAVQCGVTSLNVIIPVMVHDNLNSDFVFMPIFELEATSPAYATLTPENKVFVQDMNTRFNRLSQQEKDIVVMGIRLVKDADMLANLRVYKRMFDLMETKKITIEPVSPVVLRMLHTPQLVSRDFVKSSTDAICNFLSWGTSIYYPYCLQSLIDEKTFEKARDLFFIMVKNSDKSDEIKEQIEKDIYTGIDILHKKMKENIIKNG